ncbi:MAG: hypothetical protein Q9185_004566 [Variospora sp. 1 TL-2023]
MPADTQRRVFGPPGFKADIQVPKAYTDPTGKCEMVIRPNLFKETPDRSSWYDLWAAAVAVRQQCVLARRAGQADNVGSSIDSAPGSRTMIGPDKIDVTVNEIVQLQIFKHLEVRRWKVAEERLMNYVL